MKHIRLWILIISIITWITISGCGKSQHSELWGSGILEATEVAISSQTTGHIMVIRYDEGDVVAKGDTIAVIDTTDLVLQRKGLSAQLDELDASVKGVRLSAARAQDELDLAKLTAERTEALYKKGSATQQARDEATTRRASAELNLQGIRNQLNELDARRENIKSAKDLVQKKIHDATIRAPLYGTVIIRSHQPGELALFGEKILTMANLDSMWIKIYLKEDILNRVALRAKADIRVDAIGDSLLPGAVAWIASEAEFTPKNVVTRESRTGLVYAVKIDVPNPSGILKIGMPAEVEIRELP
jgi:HlyD family secretion protein